MVQVELTMTDSECHDCHDLLGSLSDYVDGELEEAVCHEIEAHMAGCENCRIVIDTLQKTVLLYQTTPAPDLPDGVRTRLYAALNLDELLAKQPDDPGTEPT